MERERTGKRAGGRARKSEEERARTVESESEWVGGGERQRGREMTEKKAIGKRG
jgi:hypothetical protein